MTSQQLLKLCRTWQKRLRLEDWDVALCFAPPHAMSKPDALGQVQACAERKDALIKILRPEDWTDSPFGDTVETTLVHELVHIHTIPIHEGANGASRRLAEEQALSGLVPALVEGWTRRGKR